MTVTSTVSRASYTAVGAETSVAVPFPVQRASDLQVYRTQTGGSATLLTYGTHYTIPTADLGSPTFSILLVTPATAGDVFQLRRVLPLLQDLDLRNQGSYQPESLEDQLDRNVEMMQALSEDMDALAQGTGGAFVYDTTSAATLPIADATNAGRVYRVQDAGVQDRFAISVRLAAGTFTMLWLPVSPVVSVDNALVRYDGTHGDVIQASPVIVSDAGAISGVTSLAASADLTSSGGLLGYTAGAGGTISQATSKATGVTLSKSSGQITMNNAALNAGVAVSFVLTNTLVAATDLLVLNHVSVGNVGDYVFSARCAAGSATVTVRNVSGGNLSEAIVVGFAVVKGATA